MNGFLPINKPAGPSSFDIVRQLKKQLPKIKIGHLGTLDPAAQGLLVCAIGDALKVLDLVNCEPKEYTFTIVFGSLTDTLDDKGTVVLTNDHTPDKEALVGILAQFTGRIQQVPPVYSAIKIDGERAYARARRNEEVTMVARETTIFSLTCGSFDTVERCAQMRVSCSGGTYVRSLGRDIAAALGTCGHVKLICRQKIGIFALDRAIDIYQKDLSLTSHIVSIPNAAPDVATVTIADADCLRIRQGQNIAAHTSWPNLPALFACDTAGKMVAVLKRIDNNMVHPDRVFSCT